MNKVITAAAGHPDISIIVSVYNEEESLGLFFETIRKTMNGRTDILMKSFVLTTVRQTEPIICWNSMPLRISG